jgi:hypothetical protein
MQNGKAGARALGHPKGRQVDAASRRRVQALLGEASRRPKLLIE